MQIVYRGGAFSPVCTYHLSVCKKQQPGLQTIHRDDEDEQDEEKKNYHQILKQAKN